MNQIKPPALFAQQGYFSLLIRYNYEKKLHYSGEFGNNFVSHYFLYSTQETKDHGIYKSCPCYILVLQSLLNRGALIRGSFLISLVS